MSALALATVMDAIATAASSASGIERSYARPVEAIRPPCVVVGYPEDDIDFDVTFGNGAARATFPVWAVLGLQQDESTHLLLSSLATFAVLDAIGSDPVLLALGAVRVDGARIEAWDLGSEGRPLVHTAVRFSVEVTA